MLRKILPKRFRRNLRALPEILTRAEDAGGDAVDAVAAELRQQEPQPLFPFPVAPKTLHRLQPRRPEQRALTK